MIRLTYAGIGARATPHAVLEQMTVIAVWLARKGWHLHSGGAAGGDTAFAAGAPASQRTLFLPWRGYRGHGGAGLPHALGGTDGPLPRHRLHPASRLAPLLARRPQVARPQRRFVARRRYRRACRRGGCVERARGGDGRHRHGQPHRSGARHPDAEPGCYPPIVCERLEDIRIAALRTIPAAPPHAGRRGAVRGEPQEDRE